MRADTAECIQGSGHKRPTMTVGIPTFGMVPIEFYISSQRMLTPINARMENIIIRGEEVGVAREMIAQRVLKSLNPSEFILFLGDDMIPHWDALVLLYEEAVKGNWDVLGALYFIKQDGAIPMPILWRDDVVGYLKEGIHYNLGEVAISDIVGMDFTLVRTDSLKKMQPPYFKTGPTENTQNKAVWYHTEDSWFCRKAKAAGLKIGVHTGVRVAHLDIKTGEVY